MSNVTKFPTRTITLARLYCEDCALPLTYWLGTDGDAYGLCPRCDLQHPEEIEMNAEETLQ